MPVYDLLIVMRSMKEPQTLATMKRMGEMLLNKGMLLKSIENLGLNRDLPYKFSKHGRVNHTGSYFMYRFHGTQESYAEMKDEIALDVDVIKSAVARVRELPTFECTLEDELQIPSKRPSVVKMMEAGFTTKRREYTGVRGGPF